MAQITTPSGYLVEFKEQFTFGDRRAIKRIMLNQMKIDMNVSEGKANQKTETNAGFTQDVEDEVFRRAILSITKDGKKVTGDLLTEVYSWADVDGEAVFDYLNSNFDPFGNGVSEKKA